jgi:thymidylate kinase
MSSYLVGGWIKHKYQSAVVKTFADERKQATRELSWALGERVSDDLVRAVSIDDQATMLRLLPKIRRSLATRSIMRAPVMSLASVAQHYSSEIRIRFTPSLLDEVCVLGPDGSGKSSVSSLVAASLGNTTKEVRVAHLRPRWFRIGRSNATAVVDVPHIKPPRSSVASIVKILLWLFAAWVGHFWNGHKNATLRIWDRYYHDLLVDPSRYRYGGPIRFAQLVASVMPQPMVWILLDAPAEVIQSRKHEVSFEESSRQRKAYLSLVRQSANAVVVDATNPLHEVVEDVRAAILDRMQERMSRELRVIIGAMEGTRTGQHRVQGTSA